ncbi:hypothetical protein KKH43_02970 [Patescibacteria group bacterium]|nr:hypothetical protein [Patescibacteria group bacterium]
MKYLRYVLRIRYILAVGIVFAIRELHSFAATLKVAPFIKEIVIINGEIIPIGWSIQLGSPISRANESTYALFLGIVTAILYLGASELRANDPEKDWFECNGPFLHVIGATFIAVPLFSIVGILFGLFFGIVLSIGAVHMITDGKHQNEFDRWAIPFFALGGAVATMFGIGLHTTFGISLIIMIAVVVLYALWLFLWKQLIEKDNDGLEEEEQNSL